MNPRHRVRRAFSLIELSMVIVTSGILAGGCAMILRQAYLLQCGSLRTVTNMRSLQSLRLRWIDDVQAAREARIGDSLELLLADESSIRYALNDRQMERQKIRGDAVIGRDEWMFSAPVTVQWTSNSARPRQIVSMRINSVEATEELSDWTFHARLGAMP